MKNTLIRLALIGGLATAVIVATGAFFSDTETSIGNTLVAGAIDLKVDNTSYYNGVFNQATSWGLTDLNEQNRFFDFRDLKPGDFGEDTISLHVDNNDAWLCADVTLTSNDDVNCTEPELADDLACLEPNGDNTDGDLAGRVNFIWWADDGDNVFESDETLLQPAGNMGLLGVGNTTIVTLADSQSNIWNPGLSPSPFPGGLTDYIGKGWCFGTFTMTPVEQDGPIVDINPADGIPDNGPDSGRGAGYTCDGSSENNAAQTDSMTADISFRAEQARNNANFLCNPLPSPSPSPSPEPSPSG